MSVRDYNVLGKAGDDKPLPEWIEGADQLGRLVEFFVMKGWNVWPLPAKIKEAWCRPLLHNNEWLVGEKALKKNWGLFLMGRLREQFAKHFKVVEQTQLVKNDNVRGLLILTKPLDMNEVLRFLEDQGYVKKAGRA